MSSLKQRMKAVASRVKLTRATLFGALVFVLVGSVVAAASVAFVSQEVELGTHSGNVVQVSDGAASGGSTSGENNQADGVHDLKFIESIFQRRKFSFMDGTRGTVEYTSTNCGMFGPIANFYDRPGNTWRCNRWDNGNELASSVTNPTYGTNVGC